MEENSDTKQRKGEEQPAAIGEMRAEAETLVGQIKQMVEACQKQEGALRERTEALVQRITQAEQGVAASKVTVDGIVQSVQKEQTGIGAAAKEIQETKARVESRDKEIEELKAAVEAIAGEATERKSSIDADSAAIQQAKTKVEADAKSITQAKANVDQLGAGLKAIADTADQKVETVGSLRTALEGLSKEWTGKFESEFGRSKESFTAAQQRRAREHEALTKQIEGLLPGATSAGLASAFRERKNDVGRFKWFWGLMVLVAAAGLIVVGIYTIKNPPNIQMKFYDFMIYILTRSSIIAGIILIEEFSRRHFNIISRLTETYAYREVLSSSFEGYKKQMEAVELETTINTSEIDSAGKEVKRTIPIKATAKLSDKLIENLAVDPASIYEKEKPISTPAVDTTELAAQTVNKAVEQLGRNRFEIGWKVLCVSLAIVIATVVTVLLLVK